MSFLKLDLGILDSSLWVEDAEVRIVFITMLAMVDATGLCAATAPGIARRANLPLDRVHAALTQLEAPDAESRTLEHDGRRCQRVDGGYLVLNYLKYQKKDHTAASRARRYRQRHHSTVTRDERDVTRNVTHVDVDVDVDEDNNKRLVAPSGATGSSPSKPARKRKPWGNPDIPALVAHYEAEFTRTRGCAPVVRHGAAEKSFQALLAGRTLDQAKGVVTDLLQNPPQFYADRELADPEHVVKAANVILARRRG